MRLGLRGKIILSLVGAGVAIEALLYWIEGLLERQAAHLPEIVHVLIEMSLIAGLLFLWGSYISAKLVRLGEAAKSIAYQGPGVQIQESGSDEILEINRSFNQMSASLKSSQQELKDALEVQHRLAEETETHRSILRATLSASLDAIITINEAGKVVEFSESAERIFGFTRDEILNKELAHYVIPKQYREAHRQGMERFRKSGEAVVLGQRLELSALRKSGEEFPCELAISKVELGNEILFTAFMRDISDRRGYEEELQIAAHAFEASEAIIITDEQAKIVRANKAFSSITGYELEDVLGKNPKILASGQHDKDFYKQMWQQLSEEGTWSGEIINRRKNGELLPELLTITAVTNREGAISHYVAHFTDLSEQKAVESSLRQAREQAETASQAKSRFLATMSHEIRTPLNAIINMNQLLAETKLTEQQLQLVKTAGQAGQTLVALLNNVLDFSRIEAGRIELQPEWFSLMDAVAAIVEIFEPCASQKKLNLSLNVASKMPAEFYCDSLRFRQILLNLIGNAVKFTEQGSISIRLDLNKRGHLEIQVEDTGPGIDPEAQQQLFAEFFQVDDSRTRHHSGTGLGLAITQQLVELMDGEIRVQSEPGQGSVFTVELPLINRQQEIEHKQSGSVTLLPLQVDKPTVLLVEDSASNRAVATEVLKKQVERVYVAENGLRAVEMAAQYAFDVILMDMAMPVMDGLEATRHIRANKGLNQQTPILAMTANAFEEDKESCLSAGMDDFISKPLDIAMLRSKVRQWSGQHSTKLMPESVESSELMKKQVPTYLDKAILQKLSDEAGTEALHHIVELFQQEAPERMEALLKAIEAKNLSEAEIQAHTLKSSAGTLGLLTLQEQAKATEFAAKESDQLQLEQLADQLGNILDISLIELELFVKNSTKSSREQR